MKKNILLTTLSLMVIFSSPAFAVNLSNGDFETGDLTGYFVQEDLTDVPSSSLVQNVNDGTGNRVGEILTGFTSNGVTTSTLARDFGTLPSDVQDLVFDVKFFDVGADNPPIFTLVSSPEFIAFDSVDQDILNVSLQSDAGTLPNFFQLSSSGFIVNNPDTQVANLSNGFYRVTTNVSSLGGSTNNKLYFDLTDEDDLRLSKVHVDNIDLTSNQAVAPEPASMLLIGSGLLGFGYLRKKKLV